MPQLVIIRACSIEHAQSKMIQSIYMRRAGQLFQALFVALMMVLIKQAPALAESSSSFFQTIRLSQDGVLDVTERIDIDFADSTRPAIYRVIPIDYRAIGGDYHTEVRVISVRDQADAPVEFSESRL